MPDLEKFIHYVREMRTYQKDFFRLQAMAKKNPAYHPARKDALMSSKRFETDVDHMLEEMGKGAQACHSGGNLLDTSSTARSQQGPSGMTAGRKEVSNG